MYGAALQDALSYFSELAYQHTRMGFLPAFATTLWSSGAVSYVVMPLATEAEALAVLADSRSSKDIMSSFLGQIRVEAKH